MNSAGTISTTSSRRRLCAAATLAASAWCRLASTTISLAPPGMLAKNAVARSLPLRSRMKMPISPSSRVPTAPARITPKCASTSRITSPVKCRPMALATIHCPTCRPRGTSLTSQPLQLTAITASSEPTIHGSGQLARLASQPPNAPISGVAHEPAAAGAYQACASTALPRRRLRYQRSPGMASIATVSPTVPG